MAQSVISGRDSLRNILKLTEKLNIRRPMIVGTEPLPGTLMKKAPALLECPVFSAFHSNPDLKDAAEGIRLFRESECDGLISIGGGSSIDTAKAIKAMMYAGSAEDTAANRYPEEMPLRHIAIPGTAGTGSEATQIAVVYVEGKKVSLNHPKLLPDGVVLDAALLDSLPVYHKKSCALDALAQGIESYWCKSANDDSRVHAYLAILGVLDNLKAYLEGDPHAAEEMLDASYQSGKAIQITRTTAAHAMSYMLTKKMGYAHGHAVMLTLPTLWDMMADREDMQEVLGSITGIMRLGDPRMVSRMLRGILYDLEMEIPAMPDEETLDELADSVNTERLQNHPVALSRNDVKEAYRKAFTPQCAAEKQACIDILKYYNS